MRLCFAVRDEVLNEACERIKTMKGGL